MSTIDLGSITELEAIQLLQTLSVAKFSSQHSSDICQIDVLNSLIKKLLQHRYEDNDLGRVAMSFSDRTDIFDAARTTLQQATRDFVFDRNGDVSEEEISQHLASWAYPGRLAPEQIGVFFDAAIEEYKELTQSVGPFLPDI